VHLLVRFILFSLRLAIRGGQQLQERQLSRGVWHRRTGLVKDISRPQNADDANENPKRIQHKIGSVALDPGAPGEHDGVGGVENPDEHKRTFRPEPADEAEAENSHQYADQFDGFKVTDNKCIHAGILLHPTGSNHKIHQQLQVLRDAVCCSTSTAASGAGHD